jgi:hypothetical protein
VNLLRDARVAVLASLTAALAKNRKNPDA